MAYRLLADVVLLAHLAFVVFAVAGGLLVLRYPVILRFHLPVLVWGILVEAMDWICPLTPLENTLWLLGQDSGYSGGFVEHWVFKLLYLESLTIDLRTCWRSSSPSRTRRSTATCLQRSGKRSADGRCENDSMIGLQNNVGLPENGNDRSGNSGALWALAAIGASLFRTSKGGFMNLLSALRG